MNSTTFLEQDHPFVSVFNTVFDVAVFGAGFAGYAAAEHLVGAGLKTLLVESSGNLLWEATRALENTASGDDPGFARWLEPLRKRQAVNNGAFDPAVAEIVTAHHLANRGPRTLLHSCPVALETEGEWITGVIVATRSGPRRIVARRWVDATENGLLIRRAIPHLKLNAAVRRTRAMIVQAVEPGEIQSAVIELSNKQTDLESRETGNIGEIRLCWNEALEPWHRRVPALTGQLRELVRSPWIVSHCAMLSYSEYETFSQSVSNGDLPANLALASPALSSGEVRTLSDRWRLGRVAAETTERLPEAKVALKSGPIELPDFDSNRETQVLVAGGGTAGALAGIAAARGSARTLLIDQETYLGGIGTGAGICGYFHGASGGLQNEIDERVREMTERLTGTSAGRNGWHHEAKKMVLLHEFEKAGGEFLGETLLAGVEQDGGQVQSILAISEGRVLRIRADAYIDATGDGDLAALAGAKYQTGRPGDGRSLSYSQSVFTLNRGDNRLSVHACNFDAGWVDPTDPEDLSRARLAGIAQHFDTLGKSSDRIVAVAPLLGLRQSRQIATDTQITIYDLVSDRRFPDAIGHAETVADTHSVDFEFETDELAFYYWTCRGFRHRIQTELPYRMLLPIGLRNVWIACRAAGISVEAAYGVRMQRDMQRLGEAAGIAAALAVKDGCESREVPYAELRVELENSGAIVNRETPDDDGRALELLDHGLPGVYLWQLYRHPEKYSAELLKRLDDPNSRVSFYAAAVLAMWARPEAEPRLLEAFLEREVGPSVSEKPVTGGFGQCIDLPFWLQALVLLRVAGTELSIPAIVEFCGETTLQLNVRTMAALTLERLAERHGLTSAIRSGCDRLLATPVPDPILPPSRSLWRELHGEPQKHLSSNRGAQVAQDHTWQLHLIVHRVMLRSGIEPIHPVEVYRHDWRAFVRQAFQ